MNIVIYVGLDKVGDGLIKLPALRRLRARHPQAKITWFAGKGRTVFATDLAPMVVGLIDRVIENPAGNRAGQFAWLRRLWSERIDVVIDTQRGVANTLLLRLLRPRLFLSSALEWRLSDRRPPSWDRKGHLGRNLEILFDLAGGEEPRSVPPVPLDPGLVATATHLLPDGMRHVGLVPGSNIPIKNWPLDSYKALAERLIGHGLVPVFILGPVERDWFDGLSAALPGAKFPLQDPAADGSIGFTMAIGRQLELAVANDCGAGHILAAAETPLVSLFGPTGAAKFAPRHAAPGGAPCAGLGQRSDERDPGRRGRGGGSADAHLTPVVIARNEAIQGSSPRKLWIASLRSQ